MALFEKLELDYEQPCIITRTKTENSLFDIKKDLSVFTIDEWKYLIKISMYFRKAFIIVCEWSVDVCRYQLDKNFVESTKLFHYCDFCIYSTPMDTNYKLIMYESELYNEITYEYQDVNERGRTFNKFREWLCKNSQKIMKCFETIQQFGIQIQEWDLEHEYLKIGV